MDWLILAAEHPASTLSDQWPLLTAVIGSVATLVGVFLKAISDRDKIAFENQKELVVRFDAISEKHDKRVEAIIQHYDERVKEYSAIQNGITRDCIQIMARVENAMNKSGHEFPSVDPDKS